MLPNTVNTHSRKLVRLGTDLRSFYMSVRRQGRTAEPRFDHFNENSLLQSLPFPVTVLLPVTNIHYRSAIFLTVNELFPHRLLVPLNDCLLVSFSSYRLISSLLSHLPIQFMYVPLTGYHPGHLLQMNEGGWPNGSATRRKVLDVIYAEIVNNQFTVK